MSGTSLLCRPHRTSKMSRIPPNPREVEALAARGPTYQQIADALGISWNTLACRRRQSAEFAEALRKGRAIGVSTVTNRLFVNQKVHFKPFCPKDFIVAVPELCRFTFRSRRPRCPVTYWRRGRVGNTYD